MKHERLTRGSGHGKMRVHSPTKFLVHVRWQATSLKLWISAPDEEVALRKAARMKCNRDCWDMSIIKETQG